MKCLLNIVLAVLLLWSAGCATTSSHAKANSGPTYICHVCRYNNDLACVCVTVKESTPKTEYEGHTYYFCSEECRAAFLKKPARYLPK
jgi:YHS domain-containing protein